MIRVTRAPADFADWKVLRALVAEAFAFMDGRIDPPSSLHRMTAADFAEKARVETLLLATEDGALLGCLYAAERGEALYLGKIAVAPAAQRRGLGRALVEAAATEARGRGLAALELSTRVELVENHAAFAALGFRPAGSTAHPGYNRPTSLAFRRDLRVVRDDAAPCARQTGAGA